MVTTDTYIYTDLDELPIYNFYKCVDGKLEYLYEQKKGDVNNKINEVWNKLYNDYCEREENKSRQRQYRLIGEIKWLEMRLKIAPILFNMLLKDNYDKELIEALKQWKFNYKDNIDKQQQIDKFILILNNSQNKLKRKTDELKSFIDSSKEVKKYSLEKQAIIIKKHLNVSVDIFKDSVITWLAYWELINDKKHNSNE